MGGHVGDCMSCMRKARSHCAAEFITYNYVVVVLWVDHVGGYVVCMQVARSRRVAELITKVQAALRGLLARRAYACQKTAAVTLQVGSMPLLRSVVTVVI